jgi:SAM-dependent methyltransferase
VLVSLPLARLLPLLRSPRSLRPLDRRNSQLCTDDGEGYPIVRGIPVLIDEEASAFAIDDFVDTSPDSPSAAAALRMLAERALPSVSRNLAARGNYRRLASILAERHDDVGPRVLVIGASILGVGVEELLSVEPIELIETDVAFGPRTDMICDAHSLPFEDETFDAVICQAVLEHVADPPRVVEEIWRVLVPEGLVYSEIPFMQQVHEGAYDFTRYTLSGHRRLYRHFEALDSGATGGPGMSLAWSIVYFARALGSKWPILRDAFAAAARLLSFWLKYSDRVLLKLPGGMDAASGTFFLGRKSEDIVSDRMLVQELGGREGGYLVWRT